MGKMFDTLKQAEDSRGRHDAAASVLLAGQREVVGADLATEEEEIPFIEVGGPRGSLEASRSVLTSAPPIRRSGLAPSSLPSSGNPIAAPGTPLTVAFRPLPHETGTRSHRVDRFTPDLVAYYHPQHPASVQYAQLAEELCREIPARQSHVYLVAGLTPHAGTTTVVLNLAVSLARHRERRLVVVDANQARPAIADRMGLCQQPGLAEVLSGSESLSEALQEIGQANLTALTAGQQTAGRNSRFLHEGMRPVLRHLRDRFDLILIDGGVWNDIPALAGLTSVTDAVYLIVPEAEADSPQVEAGMQRIVRQGGRLKGCIATRW